MSTDSGSMDQPVSEQKAPRACHPCKKQKKACDKIFPSCSACMRLRRECSYDSGPSHDLESFESLTRRLTNLENEMSDHQASFSASNSIRMSTLDSSSHRDFTFHGSPTFPSAFFLDVNMFQHFGMKVHKPQVVVEGSIFREIGDDLEIQTIVGAYFFSVSTWMSIISKKRLYQEILAGQVEMAPDIALLVLCMKLLHTKLSAEQNPRTKLWSTTKNFFLALVSSGFTSIRLLQAGVLFCLYETGHAIYPEAYISIGHVGRLGQAIGLHDTAGIPQLALEPVNWDEMEERRRVWWAVWILDRHMNIGNPSRSLALEEASRREYLPVDDLAFEQGDRVSSEPLFVSSSINIAAAPFTRLCQASHLLSLVLMHVNDSICNAEHRLEEAKKLNRAILALCSCMKFELVPQATRIFVPTAICLSALFALFEHASSIEQGSYDGSEVNIEWREFGRAGFHCLAPHVAEYATHIQSILPYNIDQTSPLVCNCIYRAAVWLSSFTDETMKPDYSRLLLVTKDTLYKLSARWKVAEEYLKILDCYQSVPLTGGQMNQDTAQEMLNLGIGASSVFPATQESN